MTGIKTGSPSISTYEPVAALDVAPLNGPAKIAVALDATALDELANEMDSVSTDETSPCKFSPVAGPEPKVTPMDTATFSPAIRPGKSCPIADVAPITAHDANAIMLYTFTTTPIFSENSA
jgi:hypothetical protein